MEFDGKPQPQSRPIGDFCQVHMLCSMRAALTGILENRKEAPSSHSRGCCRGSSQKVSAETEGSLRFSAPARRYAKRLIARIAPRAESGQRLHG
jgi:hypothetical protein